MKKLQPFENLLAPALDDLRFGQSLVTCQVAENKQKQGKLVKLILAYPVPY